MFRKGRKRSEEPLHYQGKFKADRIEKWIRHYSTAFSDHKIEKEEGKWQIKDDF